MPLQIPTTKEAKELFLANLESQLGQTAPIHLKAFLRVLSATEALSFTSLFKYGLERSLQNFALTATGQDLETIGSEYGVTKKPATFAKFEVEVEVTGPGIVFDGGSDLVGVSNERDYKTDTEIISAATTVNLPVTATIAGVDSNPQLGDLMTLLTPPVGSEPEGFVDTITIEAIDEETEDSYRRRVLNEIRTVGGGGNAVDYRRWAEEAINVFRAFPYAGKPEGWTFGFTDVEFDTATDEIIFTEPFTILNVQEEHWLKVENTVSNDGIYRVKTISITPPRITVYENLTNETFIGTTQITNNSLPGDRAVYIEALESFDPDGIPNQAILDEARDTINTDPATGLTRPPLGETDEFLFVEAITRREIFVEIRGLVVDAEKESEAKAAILTSVTEHLKSLTPFIVGLDVEIERVDRISDMTISKIVGDILVSFGGFATGVGVGLEESVFISSYQLSQGELSKLGTLTYV
jgi:hypothetical protein